MNSDSIGKVIGPGEDASEFRIQSKDDRRSRIGEFVTYKIDVEGSQLVVYAVITGRRLSREIPPTFLADPDISAVEIGNALGIDNLLEGIEYELIAQTIGYFDESVGAFINPRIAPPPDTNISLATDDDLQSVLFYRRPNQPGAVEVGQLLLRSPVKAVLDANRLTATHFAILAGTGSGKSYLARVILEELLKPATKAAIAIFDPHGEYHTLEEVGRFSQFRTDDYWPEVKVLRPGETLTIQMSELSPSDISFLLPNLSEKMYETLERLWSYVYSKAPNHKWKYQELIKRIDDLIGQEQDEDDKNNSSGTYKALRWRLESRFKPSDSRPKVFVDDGGTSLQDIYSPGCCTVVSLDGLEEPEQQVIAAIILRKAYEARVRKSRNAIEANPRNALDYPIFTLLEEAHRMAPAGDDRAVSTKILKTVLAEGRKFGVGIGLISQRPGKLDQNVLSQCMTQFLMRIINQYDQDCVARGVESASRELLRELPALSPGQVIVSGSAVRSTVLLQVRRCITKHGGHSIDAVSEWENHFSVHSRSRRLGVNRGHLNPTGGIRPYGSDF